MSPRVRLTSWYWIVLAIWVAVFVSITGIISIGGWISPANVFWKLLIGWPRDDFFAAVLRPIRWLTVAPLILLPFAISRPGKGS